MRLIPTAFAALFATGLSLSAWAETPPAPPPPTAPTAPTAPAAPVDPDQAKKDAYDNEVICRTEDEIGSRLRKRRTCMTRKEWRSAAQDAQDATSGMQRSGVPPKQPGG
jgi:hypothetical protein